jgi:hypothetical protein
MGAWCMPTHAHMHGDIIAGYSPAGVGKGWDALKHKSRGTVAERPIPGEEDTKATESGRVGNAW